MSYLIRCEVGEVYFRKMKIGTYREFEQIQGGKADRITDQVKTRFFTRGRVIFAGLLLLAALIIFSVAFYLTIPRWIVSNVKTVVEESCYGCKIEISEASTALFGPHLRFDNIRLTGGYPGASEFDIRAESAIFDLEVWPLLKRDIFINSIELINPIAKVIDGEKHTPKTKDASTAIDHKFRINLFKLTGGRFDYVRNYKGTQALLHLADINLSTKPFGNTAELDNAPFEFQASTQIENSGQTFLQVSTMPKTYPQQIDVILKVKNQNLATLSKFFVPNAGVRLGGLMLEGDGKAQLRGDSLTATVGTTFENLKIDLLQHVDRSSLLAFFENAGLKLDTNLENKSKPAKDRVRSLLLKKEPGELPISFILRGLKEAALAVARAD